MILLFNRVIFRFHTVDGRNPPVDMENIPLFHKVLIYFHVIDSRVSSINFFEFSGLLPCQGHDRVGLRAQRYFAPGVSTPPLVPWTQGGFFRRGCSLGEFSTSNPLSPIRLDDGYHLHLYQHHWGIGYFRYDVFFTLSRWELAICNQLAKAKQWVLTVQCYDNICKVKMIVESV